MPYMCVIAIPQSRNCFLYRPLYVELGQLLQAYVSRLEMPTDDFQREIS